MSIWSGIKGLLSMIGLGLLIATMITVFLITSLGQPVAIILASLRYLGWI